MSPIAVIFISISSFFSSFVSIKLLFSSTISSVFSIKSLLSWEIVISELFLLFLNNSHPTKMIPKINQSVYVLDDESNKRMGTVVNVFKEYSKFAVLIHERRGYEHIAEFKESDIGRTVFVK